MPELLRCRLPALLVMSLMDLGRWQLICISDQFYQDASMQSQSWRIEQLQEHICRERHRINGIDIASDHPVKPSNSTTTENRGQKTEGLLPLNSLADFYWWPTADAIENSIMRLQAYPGDQLKKP